MELNLHKDGNEINSVEDWFSYAPPKGNERHWVDGRSAKELAKAFFRDGYMAKIPAELLRIFNAFQSLI